MKRQVVDQIDKFKKEMSEQLLRNELSVNDVKKKMNENEDKVLKNHEKLFGMFGNVTKELIESFDKKFEHLHVELGGMKG
jgi:hypothetical protein